MTDRYFVFPGNIEPEILVLGSEQPEYGRSAQFAEVVKDCELALLKLLDCRAGKAIVYTGVGTSAMDALVGSYAVGCSNVLVVNGGTFGSRVVEMCVHYNVNYEEFKVAAGRDPDYALLDSKLRSGDYEMVIFQQNETSTGQLFDVPRIAKASREGGAMIAVDAICSFLADELVMEQWGIDFVILSSHKGLSLPVGLGFLILSAEAEGLVAKGGSYSLRPQVHARSLSRGQMLYSPSTGAIRQLDMRLGKIVQDGGVVAAISKIEAKAAAFRERLEQGGIMSFPQTSSSALTSFMVPERGGNLIDYLASEHNLYVMPSGIENLVRVGHFGLTSSSDHIELADIIIEWFGKGNFL